MNFLSMLIIGASLVPGCGTTTYDGSTWIDPKLQRLVEDWTETCKKHTNPRRCNTYGIVSIKQVNSYDSPTVLGRCEIRTNNFQETRYITMLRSISPNTHTAKAILLHEMLHCRFRFEKHADVGVMQEYTMYSEEDYIDNWPRLLKETYGLVR